MLLRILRLARAAIEFAEAEETVGDEGTHAELLGDGVGLLVANCGQLDLRGLQPQETAHSASVSVSQ